MKSFCELFSRLKLGGEVLILHETRFAASATVALELQRLVKAKLREKISGGQRWTEGVNST